MCCFFVMDAASLRMRSLANRTVERIDIVDISKEVFALADFYSGINYSNPLRDPRVHADRSRRAIFSASQPAAIRHHFGRTASAENGWLR